MRKKKLRLRHGVNTTLKQKQQVLQKQQRKERREEEKASRISRESDTTLDGYGFPRIEIAWLNGILLDFDGRPRPERGLLLAALRGGGGGRPGRPGGLFGAFC